MGLTVQRFDHIVINCRDVAATAAWYGRVLGMHVETFGPARRTACASVIRKSTSAR
ncbi:catechol 2,3-dioxygenase-like lactoylglutathione lyase family enzyme [Nocardia transvalensis]|uniref:Catechol 2,3-dioxygenase-like lactoylglutathione lyase family enzyme n=1 Tax=Nocardia transvalensis TaxID=37333 RepID=A0A7W9PL61_9NOCA|nr:catechol 2,3-dioxygenase-like lactoylglutathione lyase family enzyme [Nocardia transvalensis]